MIPILSSWLFPNQPNLAEYISVRAAGALILAFLLSLFLGERTILFLRQLKVGQFIRDSQGDGAISLKKMHEKKAGTPTMGGLLIAMTFSLSLLMFGDWGQPVLVLAFVTTIGFGLIGFVDDYRKVVKKQSEGLTTKEKLAGQTLLALVFGFFCFLSLENFVIYKEVEGFQFHDVALPFVKTAVISMGPLYILYCYFVLTGTTNAVNLTDGLDGLASGVAISSALAFAVIAYLVGRVDTSAYLLIPYVIGAGELAVMMSALIGACFGFLWFNCYPARMFMGDTGSMLIGGALGAVALLTKQELLLLIVGGVFVAEAASVMLQVTSYKLTKTRIFLMSPLHHHFERLGWPESHIIVRFWMISALLALAGLSTLKLR
jgi:phospho-N-acetylmuramoyl-pentapeptide-transferase